MSRYVDIDEMGLRKTISVGGLSAKALWKMIRQQPSIDIVRCRECIDNSINCDGEENWCLRFGYDVEPSDFCSYGERKEGE